MKSRISDRSIIAGIWFFIGALAAPCLQAAVILGNLPPTNDVGNSIITSDTSQIGLIFTMGPADYTVDNVVLRLSNYNTAAGDVPVSGFFLDNGSQTNIGAQVGTSLLFPVSVSNPIANFTFTPATPITLTANTTYWLVVKVTQSSDDFNWHYSSPGVVPTGVGATAVTYKLSSNNGVTYMDAGFPNSLQINGTVVPEPNSAVLGLAGALAVFNRRFRRRTAAGRQAFSEAGFHIAPLGPSPSTMTSFWI